MPILLDEKIIKDCEKFVKEIVFNQHYLFFKNMKKHTYLKSETYKRVYCSKCKKFYETNFIKHNDVCICEECGEEVIAKNINMGRKKLREGACIYWFKKCNKKHITCYGIYLERDFDDYRNEKIVYNLNAKYEFNLDKGGSMELFEWYTNSFVKRRSVFGFVQGWLSKFGQYVSKDNFMKVVNKTDYKYMEWDIIYDTSFGGDGLVKRLDSFSKYPKLIEQIWKLGFKNVAMRIINKESTEGSINFKGCDIRKVLKLSKGKIKEIQRVKPDINCEELKILQVGNIRNLNMSVEEAIDIRHKVICIDDLVKIAKHIELKRALSYISNKSKKIKNENERSLLVLYKDYLENGKKLQYDFSDRKILLPNDLMKAHDKAYKSITVKANKDLDEKIKKRVEKLKKYEFENEKFILTPAESTWDLIQEGNSLKHCVATNYTESYANGTTGIFFIRRKEELSKSFYTMELRGDRVVQVRGYNNSIMNDEIRSFVNQFEIEKVKIGSV